jgi:hypothetical protein
MFKMMYSYQPGNNAVLSGVKAMPQKNSTSDGSSTFAGARHEYAETITSTSTPVSVKQHKKWFGNHDASEIAWKRRVQEIGVGSLNAGNGKMAFMTKNDRNSKIDALARVRGGGYVVPPKVRHTPTKSGVPISTAPIHVPVIRSQNRLCMIPTQQPKGKPYIPMKNRVF